MMEEVELDELLVECNEVIKELKKDIEESGDFELQSISTMKNDWRVYFDYLVNLDSNYSNMPIFEIIDDTIYELMYASQLLKFLETQKVLIY